MALPEMLNPICVLLPKLIETGMNNLNKVIAFQDTLKKSFELLKSATDLSSYLNNIPDGLSAGMNFDQINAVIQSCPGNFPTIDSVNLTVGAGLKDILNDFKGSPLGFLDSSMASLDGVVAPIKDLSDKLLNNLVCLKNVCNLADDAFAGKWSAIMGAKSNLNLGPDGKPQILDQTTSAIKETFSGKMQSIKALSKSLTG